MIKRIQIVWGGGLTEIGKNGVPLHYRKNLSPVHERVANQQQSAESFFL
jgi:hypothetical protein